MVIGVGSTIDVAFGLGVAVGNGASVDVGTAVGVGAGVSVRVSAGVVIGMGPTVVVGCASPTSPPRLCSSVPSCVICSDAHAPTKTSNTRKTMAERGTMTINFD